MKHKHAELIKKWADGALIEQKIYTEWVACDKPTWDVNSIYRVRQESQDFAVSANVIFEQTSSGYLKFSIYGDHNVDFIFDGNSKKLKAVNLLAKNG